MFVRDASNVIGTERDVQGPGWNSRRLIVAADGLAYSVHETMLGAGAVLRFHYTVHGETVYCVAGEGTLRNLTTGEVFDLHPGRIYSVRTEEPHELVTRTPMKFLCIFDPPLQGPEKAR